MENTCRKEKCFWWKKMKEECPMYLKGEWQSPEGQFKIIEDCAPVRNTLQLRVIHNLLIGLQQTSNQERDASNALTYVMTEVVKKATEGRVLINGLNPPTSKVPLPGEFPERVGEG